MAQRQRQRDRGSHEREPREFNDRVLDLARVTRVTKGGKRMRFRAAVIIGDGKGRVGLGVAKGTDVAAAVSKANRQARKHLLVIPLVHGTIPHEVRDKFGAARILIKPAPEGTGVKAGGAMRVVLELAGVPNVVGKTLGTSNKINNAKAMMHALASLRERAPTPPPPPVTP
ncbi:30S ribosomal protein S5 [Candidatus Uhrbacteria bacterium]|nr:30S ribosomal protein S5 [Candidatus Uhrbacteria bacterium]